MRMQVRPLQRLPLPEGYPVYELVTTLPKIDAYLIARMAASQQVVPARVIRVDPSAGMIKVHLGGPLKGCVGIMPCAEFDDTIYQSYQGIVGQVVDVLPLSFTGEGEMIAVSRRQARATKREKLLALLTEGMMVKGIVRAMQSYGAFVDIGGLHALLSVDELSHHFVKHPSEVVSLGQALDLLVTEIKTEEGRPRIRVSLKRCYDPWVRVRQSLVPGTVLLGRVADVSGAHTYVRPEPEVGVDLLCPTVPNQPYEPGAPVRVRVVKIDEGKRHLRGRILGAVAM